MNTCQNATGEQWRSEVCFCGGISSTGAPQGTCSSSSFVHKQTVQVTCDTSYSTGRSNWQTMKLMQHLDLSLDRCEMRASALRRGAGAVPPATRSKTLFSRGKRSRVKRLFRVAILATPATGPTSKRTRTRTMPLVQHLDFPRDSFQDVVKYSCVQ